MKEGVGHYLFSLRDKYYLLDIVGCAIAEIPQTVFKTIQKYDEGHRLDDSEENTIKLLLSTGMLSWQEDYLLEALDDRKKAYLSFAPTYQCNFRCSYCFGKYGEKYQGNVREFDKVTVVQMLEYFFHQAFPEANQYRIDFVSGGEPLLGMELIKTTVEYCEEFSRKSKKRISIWLCTNGSLLTDDIVEYFEKHKISIGISIDGRKDINDSVRVDSAGKGTYNRICSGIRCAQQKGKNKNLWGLCTATNDNCDFVDILNHMKELGFNNAQVRLVRGSQKYDLRKILQQYDRLSDFLFGTYVDGDLRFLKMILNDNDQFGKVLKRIMLDHLLVRRCNAGINKITICPDGSIYPCDSLVGMDFCKLGNIAQGWNQKLFSEESVETVSKCKSCDIRYLCGGDCYYNSFMKNGCLFSPDDEFCAIQKHIIELSIVLRYHMEQTNASLYNLLVRELKKKNGYFELYG